MLDVVAGLDDVDVLGDRAAENHVRQARRDDVVLDRDLVLREACLPATSCLIDGKNSGSPG